MRTHQTHNFRTVDGEELFYRSWLPEDSKSTQKAVVLFHRGHEHSGRFQELVDDLKLQDCAFFAWDCRGCGQSPGPRGDARGLGQLESDMECFIQHLSEEYSYSQEQMVVLAHSVAAVVAGLWVLDYGPRIRGLILATPALDIKLYVPFARLGLTALNSVGLMQTVSSYVRGSALTHDKAQAKLYDEDPLISKEISTRLLLDLYKGAERLLRDADGIQVATLVLAARADWVVQNEPIRQLFNTLPNRNNQLKAYEGFFHAIFHESKRELVVKDVRNFLIQRFRTEPESTSHLLEADVKGVRAAQYAWLKSGVPPVSLRNLVWSSTRLSMKTLGRASQGLRLGLKRGFSSGETLDYVYENKPRGWTLFGRMVDWVYLESLGWVCIRQRRRHMADLLEKALVNLRDAHGDQETLKIADIAGGPGRYLLDLLSKHPDEALEVTVRDADEHALQRGRELALAQKESRVKYKSGDAFSQSSIAQLGPLDLAVVSGLYELFPSNDVLLKSLAGLKEAVKVGGYLIYTNQPSHPQLELIAETLTHGDGSRWAMRCRSTAEMDELVRHCGFKKSKTLIDDHGIFSVSLAQRVE